MNFIIKSLIKKQLAGVPEEQINMIVAAIEKDPGFFQKLAIEIQTKIKSGKSEQEAAQEILASHTEKLKGIFGA